MIEVSKLSEFWFLSSTKAQSEICDDNEGVTSCVQADFVIEQTVATTQGIGVAIASEDGRDHTAVNSSGCEIGLISATPASNNSTAFCNLVTCVHHFRDHVMQAVVLSCFDYDIEAQKWRIIQPQLDSVQ